MKGPARGKTSAHVDRNLKSLIQLPKPETNAPICQDVDITVGAVGISLRGIKFPLRTDVYSLVPDTVFVTRLVVGPGF